MLMKIVLTKPYADFVKERIDEGVYENASEAIRDALRQMADRVRMQKTTELKAALQEGFDSGIDENFSFARLVSPARRSKPKLDNKRRIAR
jgi:antitoxin ParD1/3/4